MTERIDRIEQAVERTASNVDDLLGAIATTQADVLRVNGNVDKLTRKASDTDKLFETLRAEAQNDREESRRNTDMLTANTQRLEQSVSKLSDNVGLLVAENRSQRETVNELIKLATALVNQRAS